MLLSVATARGQQRARPRPAAPARGARPPAREGGGRWRRRVPQRRGPAVRGPAPGRAEPRLCGPEGAQANASRGPGRGPLAGRAGERLGGRGMSGGRGLRPGTPEGRRPSRSGDEAGAPRSEPDRATPRLGAGKPRAERPLGREPPRDTAAGRPSARSRLTSDASGARGPSLATAASPPAT